MFELSLEGGDPVEQVFHRLLQGGELVQQPGDDVRTDLVDVEAPVLAADDLSGALDRARVVNSFALVTDREHGSSASIQDITNLRCFLSFSYSQPTPPNAGGHDTRAGPLDPLSGGR
jgi:hypothetical protein